MFPVFRLMAILVAMMWLPQSAEAGDPYVDDLVMRAQGMELGRHKQWLRFGHWRESLLGGVKTEVDGPFFLAKNGATDPSAELEATLRGFFRAPAGDKHPRCRYPARFRWLQKELGIDEGSIPQKKCPKYQTWKANLQATSATLVFSSYYLNNAASAFGHTFLRLNRDAKSTGGKRQALLDTGINYSATVTTNNALMYAFYGLVGLFKGQFTALPYFYKVREYNDFESRDLWEYELNLDATGLDRLTDHVWELGNTYFDYWYLSENCSYHILTTVEIADPSLDLTSKLHWPVIPADTVKAIARSKGLVRKIDFRPSARSQLKARTDAMTSSQRAWVAKLASKPELLLPASMSVGDQVRVIDAAADLIDIRHAKELVESGRNTEGARLKQSLLARRAKMGVTSQELEVQAPWAKAPHRGHDSRRLGLGGGYGDERGGFATLRFRLAMHDLVDSSIGFPDTTRLEFLPTTIRWWVDDDRAALEETYLVRVASLSPISRFNQKMSWRVDAGMKRVFDDGCDDCLAGHAEFGAGLTAGFGSEDQVMLYVMSDVEAGWAKRVDGIRSTGFRFGIGPSAALRLRWSPRLITLISGSWHWMPDQPSTAAWTGDGETRLQLSPSTALSVGAELNNRELETRGSWMIYF